MAFSDNKSPAANMDHVHESIVGQTVAPANTQDQMLLKALQAFIVPLIRAVDQTKEIDINQIPLGPEAGKLITALQEFVSSVVIRRQPDLSPTTIKVNLANDENVLHTDGDGVSDGDEALVSLTRTEGPSYTQTEHTVVQRAMENDRAVFYDKLIRALREHVSNRMPIRLLCIEPFGPDFKISLLEKEAVSRRLESLFQEKIYDEEFHPQYYVDGEDPAKETDDLVSNRLISKYTQYAILSHTWLRTASGEVSYSDWNKGVFDAKDPGHQKLVNFCKTTWKDHGLTFGWMDTVCINKESSAELDESIRSMYNWYSRAAVCITYLAETRTISDMHKDSWFTRGWTLQELFAPNIIKFYNKDWNRLVEDLFTDKVDERITDQIQRATTISEEELTNIHNSPISRRMQLAATRKVTREEDTAYSLMGIFNVSVSIAYGEGAERAFSRLLQEILVSSKNTLDVFNWAGSLPQAHPPQNSSMMLPSSPRYYLNRTSGLPDLQKIRTTEPLIYTHLGLRVPVILMPGLGSSTQSIVSQHYDPVGNYRAIVNISPIPRKSGPFGSSSTSTTYTLLDKRIFDPATYAYGQDLNSLAYHTTFAVFNFEGNATAVIMPIQCVARCLLCSESVGEVSGLELIETLETTKPIVFDLRRTVAGESLFEVPDTEFPYNFYLIKRDELVNHGMQMVTLYL